MKIKKTLSWLLMALIVFSVAAFSFSIVQALDEPLGTPSGVILPGDTGLSDKTVEEILTQLLKWLLQIVGVIAIMGFVISGIMYLVSTGNEEMIKKAKQYMTYCLIGIVVVLASFVVVQAIDNILQARVGT